MTSFAQALFVTATSADWISLASVTISFASRTPVRYMLTMAVPFGDGLRSTSVTFGRASWYSFCVGSRAILFILL
uniref:Putative secreted protein n=1 Tax=Anopheles triannulatus TaxID=58253 RepID=A0A2M4B641_9DIPT